MWWFSLAPQDTQQTEETEVVVIDKSLCEFKMRKMNTDSHFRIDLPSYAIGSFSVGKFKLEWFRYLAGLT